MCLQKNLVLAQSVASCSQSLWWDCLFPFHCSVLLRLLSGKQWPQLEPQQRVCLLYEEQVWRWNFKKTSCGSEGCLPASGLVWELSPQTYWRFGKRLGFSASPSEATPSAFLRHHPGVVSMLRLLPPSDITPLSQSWVSQLVCKLTGVSTWHEHVRVFPTKTPLFILSSSGPRNKEANSSTMSVVPYKDQV